MIRIELKDDRIGPALDRLAALLDDLTPVMERIGDYLVGATKDRFQAGTAPDGTRWAPKSPATLAAYGARKSNRIDIRPLWHEGYLARSIAYQAGRDSVEVGSNRIYAAVMQFGARKGAFGRTSRGASIPWGDIPARPFLGISEADESAILGIIDDWMARAAGR